MLSKKICNELEKLCEKHGGNIALDYPLYAHSTIYIGGKADVWYTPASVLELQEAKALLVSSDIKTIVIGSGSNVLIPDEGIKAVVINLSGDAFKEISTEGRNVTASSGVKLSSLISKCCQSGLAGLEGLVGIPATLGGALVMNAAYEAAISQHLSKVFILDASGNAKWIEKRDIEFGYRFSSFDKEDIILQAVFNLEEKSPENLKKTLKELFIEKQKRQPLDEKTLGCVFKNTEQSEYTSGELIDKAGMKGYSCDGAQISEKHANFIVNTGGATSKDVVELMEIVKEKVRGEFSVELEPEIEILGA